MKKVFTIINFTLIMAFAIKAHAQQLASYQEKESINYPCKNSINLVVNSDFNLGNTGFTSTLPYGINCSPGCYYVGTNMQSKCNKAQNICLLNEQTSIIIGREGSNLFIAHINENLTLGCGDSIISNYYSPMVNHRPINKRTFVS